MLVTPGDWQNILMYVYLQLPGVSSIGGCPSDSFAGISCFTVCSAEAHFTYESYCERPWIKLLTILWRLPRSVNSDPEAWPNYVACWFIVWNITLKFTRWKRFEVVSCKASALNSVIFADSFTAGGCATTPSGLHAEAYYVGFTGCLAMFSINGQTVDLIVDRNRHNTISFCDRRQTWFAISILFRNLFVE